MNVKQYNQYFIDSKFYYMKDPSDDSFCYHYYVGLTYKHDKEESLMYDLNKAFKRNGVKYCSPDYDDYDFYEDPINTGGQQDYVFSYYFDKGNSLYNYIKDVMGVIYKYKPLLLRSTDHRSFLEQDNINLDVFKRLYKAEINSVIFKYVDFLGEKARHEDTTISTESQYVIDGLNEAGYEGAIFKTEGKYSLLSAYCDFIHTLSNYILKLVAKGDSISLREKKLLNIMRAAYSLAIYRKPSIFIKNYDKEIEKYFAPQPKK